MGNNITSSKEGASGLLPRCLAHWARECDCCRQTERLVLVHCSIGVLTANCCLKCIRLKSGLGPFEVLEQLRLSEWSRRDAARAELRATPESKAYFARLNEALRTKVKPGTDWTEFNRATAEPYAAKLFEISAKHGLQPHVVH